MKNSLILMLLVALLVGSALTQNTVCLPQFFSSAIYTSIAVTVDGSTVFQEQVGQYYFDVTQQAVAITSTDLSTGASYEVLALYKTGEEYVFTDTQCTKTVPETPTLENCFVYTSMMGPYALGAVLDTWLVSIAKTGNITSLTILVDSKNTLISSRTTGAFANGESSGTFTDYTMMYNVSLNAVDPSRFVPPSICTQTHAKKAVHFGGVKPVLFPL